METSKEDNSVFALKVMNKYFKASPKLVSDSLEIESRLVLFKRVLWSSNKTTEVEYGLIKALGIQVFRLNTLPETLET